MPISVACACGKKFNAADKAAGRTLKCPGCGQPLHVPGAPTGAAASSFPGASKPVSRVATPSFTLSPKYIVLIVLAIVIPALIFWVKQGPMKAQYQWQEMSGTGEDAVIDLVSKALQVKYKGDGGDLSKVHFLPKAAHFVWDDPKFMLKLPTWVEFQGSTSENGHYRGRFNTASQKVEAEIEHHDQIMKLVGSEANGKVELEIDGVEIHDAEINGK